jgi:hypothetical protein
MKPIILIGAILATIAGTVGGHTGETHPSKKIEGKDAEVTVEDEIDTRSMSGEIIDITCYTRHDSKGPEHLKCAVYCANLGMPLGFLEDDTNKVYLILPSGHADPKEAVMPYMAKHVNVDAIIYVSGGLAGVEILEIAELIGTQNEVQVE